MKKKFEVLTEEDMAELTGGTKESIKISFPRQMGPDGLSGSGSNGRLMSWLSGVFGGHR